METNRMMSPAARRLAAVVLAALLCLSLFWPKGCLLYTSDAADEL